MADLLGLDVKAKVDAVPNDPPELNYEVWLKAVYNAVEEWVGIQASVQSVSANTTLTKGSPRTTKITTGATNMAVTLPVGSTCREGQRFRVLKVDSGTGNVSFARQSTDTINGVASLTLLHSQYSYIEVEWMGGGLWAITPGGPEYGSNSNGEYIVFSNGWQVCWNKWTHTSIGTTGAANAFGNTAGTFRYHITDWTFPAAFADDSRYAKHTSELNRSDTCSSSVASATAQRFFSWTGNATVTYDMWAFAIGWAA